MLLQRAKEEVVLTKNEMINYIQFLADKRLSLKESTHSEEEDKTTGNIAKYNLLIKLKVKVIGAC